MKIRVFKLCFSVFFLCAFLHSCIVAKPIETSQINKKFTEKENVMPIEFGKEGTVLVLMLENKSSYDNFLKKVFTTYYKGECVFVNKTELSLKYIDREKYRYYFTYMGVSGRVDNSLKEYYIFDRVEGKKYPFIEEISFTRNALKVYAEILEKKRLSSK